MHCFVHITLSQWRSWLRVRRSRSHSMADGECASFTFPRRTTDHLFTSSRWWYYSVRRGFLFQENHDLYSIDVLMMCNQRLKFVPRLRERFEGLIMRLRERILPITWTRKHSCEIMIGGGCIRGSWILEFRFLRVSDLRSLIFFWS